METIGVKDLYLVEINGRNGNNAKFILDYLFENHINIYEHTHYYIVNPNNAFMKRQKLLIEGLHKNIRFIPKKITDWNIPQELKNNPSIVMGIEVLDILPHDKVKFNEDKNEWEEVYIEYKDNIPCEVTGPMTEEVKEALNYFDNKIIEKPELKFKEKILLPVEKFLRKFRNINTKIYNNSIFLPTGALDMFKYLKTNLPESSILFTSINYNNIK